MTKHTPKLSLANPITAFLLLIAVFAVTGVATFGARRLRRPNLYNQPSQAELLQARSEAIAAIPQLPKDTEEKLSSALDPQLAPITAAFVDPLVDRFGVDRNLKPNTSRPTSVSLSSQALIPEIPDRIARLTRWQQSLRVASANGLPAPSITTAYLISEVSAAGRIITTNSQSALLYIDSEKRQIAVDAGARFYDGVLLSIDPQGVVFRTSTGDTKLMQWDRQEEFSTKPLTAPTALPQQKSQLKPAGQTRINRPFDQSSRDDYSDLQEAVRDRYTETTVPDTPKPEINPSSEQIVLPTHKETPTQLSAPALTKSPNPFSINSPRQNKPDYAHALLTTPRLILNFRRATQPAVFNLDDPTSFANQINTANQTTTARS
jgi:hypothetical protein